MQPIKNSVIREQIRQKNEASAQSKEKQLLDRFELYKKSKLEKCEALILSLNQQKEAQIKQVNKNMKADLKAANKSISSLRGGSSSSLLGLSMLAYLINPVAGVATTVTTTVASGISRKNKEKKISALEDEKDRIESDAENEIEILNENLDAESKKIIEELQQEFAREERKLKDAILKIYNAADQQTVKELEAYDREMNAFANNVLSQNAKFSPMVDAIVNVFKDLKAEVKYETLIKFDLKYKVTPTEIIFDCGSSQQSSRNYNFFKEGFSELSKDSECEGMAKALLMLTKTRIAKISPTMALSFDHIDSQVTVHFKGVNPNGRPL